MNKDDEHVIFSSKISTLVRPYEEEEEEEEEGSLMTNYPLPLR